MVMDRPETNIIVKIPVFDSLFNQALEKYNKKYPNNPATGFKTAYVLGYVQTKAGQLYIFDTEGCGPSDPITKDNPAEIELYPVIGFQPLPPSAAFTARLTDEQILSLPTESEPEDLSRFIRKFGRRLDANFDAWRRLLKPLV